VSNAIAVEQLEKRSQELYVLWTEIDRAVMHGDLVAFKAACAALEQACRKENSLP
jgi:hypothetical protein